MSHTFIITSAAYVDSEQIAEFGLLPPAFLPLGNRRLFVHQHQALKSHASRIVLTIPEGFKPDPVDEALLEALGIEVLPVPEGLSLGHSVIYAINVAACAQGPVSILHGDSLLTGLAYGTLDAVSVSESAPPPGYGWAWARKTGGGIRLFKSNHLPEAEDRALTGFFAFSDGARLVQAIARKNGDFIAGLADYAEKTPLGMLACDHWFDFGHSSTYHLSRRRITTERDFNRLSSVGRSMTKSGSKPEKLLAEARWFETLPPPLRVYTPGYLGRQGEGREVSYSLEYLHLPTLSDLSVFGRLELNSWKRIFAACDEVLSALAGHPGPAESLEPARGLYLDKTLQRLDQLAASRPLDLTAPCRLNGRPLPSLREMAERAASLIPEPDRTTLIHGDFCFSNILYDMRANIARVIDPRGIDARGTLSSFGDIRYDIAKLYHSAIGLYDHILAGNFSLGVSSSLDFSLELPDTRAVRLIQDAFVNHRFAGLSITEAHALPISVLLFLSMPPLHADDPNRQMALLANGLRLFSLLDGEGAA